LRLPEIDFKKLLFPKLKIKQTYKSKNFTYSPVAFGNKDGEAYTPNPII